MSSRVSHLIGGLAPSATLAVDAKAKALRAEGRPIIGFGAGQPDFPTPGYIAEAAAQACLEPKNHKYTAASITSGCVQSAKKNEVVNMMMRRKKLVV